MATASEQQNQEVMQMGAGIIKKGSAQVSVGEEVKVENEGGMLLALGSDVFDNDLRVFL